MRPPSVAAIPDQSLVRLPNGMMLPVGMLRPAADYLLSDVAGRGAEATQSADVVGAGGGDDLSVMAGAGPQPAPQPVTAATSAAPDNFQQMLQSVYGARNPEQEDRDRSSDRAMALMQAGFGTMAAASQPGATALGAVGAGGMHGVKTYQDEQKARAVREVAGMERRLGLAKLVSDEKTRREDRSQRADDRRLDREQRTTDREADRETRRDIAEMSADARRDAAADRAAGRARFVQTVIQDESGAPVVATLDNQTGEIVPSGFRAGARPSGAAAHKSMLVKIGQNSGTLYDAAHDGPGVDDEAVITLPAEQATRLAVARGNNDARIQIAGMTGDNRLAVQDRRNQGAMNVQDSRNAGSIQTQLHRNEGAADVQDRRNQGAAGVAATNAGSRENAARIAAEGRARAGGGAGQTERIINLLKQENPNLSTAEALALTKRAPNGDMETLRRESLALSAAKADLKYMSDPQGTLEKYRTQQYKLPATNTTKPTTSATQARIPAAPREPSQRVVGQRYLAPDGRTVEWAGNGWRVVGR